MYSGYGYLLITAGGFSHSDISGSKPACGSPKLIAANHVLHRLLAPRHPPYALSSLTITLNPFRRLNRLAGRGQDSEQAILSHSHRRDYKRATIRRCKIRFRVALHLFNYQRSISTRKPTSLSTSHLPS